MEQIKKINVELLLQNGFLISAKRLKIKRKSASTDSDSTDKDKDKDKEKEEEKEKEEDEDEDEDDDANSEQQTKTKANLSAAVGIIGNQPKGNFSMEIYRLFVQYEQAYGKTFRNPEGAAIHFQKTGNVDERIADLLETDSTFRRECEKTETSDF